MRILVSCICILALFSCSQPSLQSGKYLAENCEFVYGIEIMEPERQIKFYHMETWSSDFTQAQLDAQKNWTAFREASISNQNEERLIVGLDSDFLPSDIPAGIEYEVTENEIKINCKQLDKSLFGSNSNRLIKPICSDRWVVFKPISN